MAKTSTERMREKKERDKRAALVAPESTAPILKKPFSEVWNENAGYSDFSMPLELAGIDPPEFDDERDPEDVIKNADAIGLEVYGVENIYGNRKGSIGRAEVTIDCLIDAAIELATFVQKYKEQQINERLKELESSSEADRATAMKEAVRLNKMLDQLSKRVRRDFPQWKVTGV